MDCGALVAAAGAGAAVDASADDGSVASEPTSSSTTGAFANGSGVLEVWGGDGAICECLSLTTGSFTVCVVWATWFFGAATVTGVRLTAGSGAGTCNFGTRSSGAATFGSDNGGSGVTATGAAACRNARTSGPTYSDTRTSTPRAVHTYLTRLLRSATSPYGLAAATDA